MKDKIHKEMCAFLSDKEQLLNGFLSFYRNNKDSNNFFELFDEEYGIIYEAFGGSVKYSVSDNTHTESNLSYEDYNTPINIDLKQPTQYANKPHSAVDNTQICFSEQELMSDVRIIRKWVQFFGFVTVAFIALSLIGAFIAILQ